MRKKLRYLLSCAVAILMFSCPVWALGEESPVHVTVDFGIYNAVKSGRYAPVNITVENNGDISEGTIRLYVPVSDRESYIYEQALSFQNGYIQEINFYIPIFYSTEEIRIEILDQKEQVVYSDIEPLNIQNDYGELFTGILDRLENAESRLNHLIIENDFDLSIREIHISTDNFPENVLDLDLMDIMIVNPSAEKILTDNKKKILDQWVEQGGICILNESSQEEWKGYGNGCYYSYPGDLFSQDEEDVRNIFLEIIGNDRLDVISNDILMGSSFDYWEISTLLNTADSDQKFSLYPYGVLLILYLITICPLAFLYLRKKKKSIYYGYHVVFCAVLFTVIIYIAGGKTRLYDSMVQYCRMIELRSDWINENNFISVRSPDNKENEILLDSAYTILPVQSVLDIYNQQEYQYSPNDYILKIENREGGNSVKIKNKKAFDTSLFLMNRTEENSENRSLEAQLNIFDNRVTGQITNHTGYELTDVFIAGYRQFYYIGDLKDGETAVLDGEELENYSPEYFSTVSGVLEDCHEGSAEYFISSSFSEPSEQFVTAGFVQIDPDFLQNEVYELSGTTIISQDCEINFTEENQTFYPVLEKRPTVISGNYRYASSMMESESCVVNYCLGEDILIDYITFYTNNCTSGENTTYRHIFDGSAWFMNWESGQYEEAGELEGIFTAEQLKPYLNENNQIQIKYQDEAYGNNIYSIGLPFITVTGREENAGY